MQAYVHFIFTKMLNLVPESQFKKCVINGFIKYIQECNGFVGTGYTIEIY